MLLVQKHGCWLCLTGFRTRILGLYITVLRTFNYTPTLLLRLSAGAALVPISWCEMQCPKTKVKEFRKVAKPEV